MEVQFLPDPPSDFKQLMLSGNNRGNVTLCCRAEHEYESLVGRLLKDNMMYMNKFVAAIKVDGKILRESYGTVTLPFGSEYSILLKNLNSVRAMAQITVDGQDATDGTKLIIPANGSVEIERFIRNGNSERGNRFKFIERNEAVEQHRGILADDGLVRVEFWTEKVYHQVSSVWQYADYTGIAQQGWLGNVQNTTSNLGVARGLNLNSAGTMYKSFASTPTMDCALNDGGTYKTQDFNDAGITVPGSESNQKFQSGSWFATEYKTDVIVLNLRGEIGGKPVAKPITVQVRPKCVTCGTVNRATSKFCSECGTALSLI